MQFKPIAPSDYPKLKPFFKNQHYRICEYSLASIVVWSNDLYQLLAASQDDALFISAEFRKNSEERHLMLPVSSSSRFSSEDLYELAVRLGFKDYWFVPEDYIAQQGKERVEARFEIQEQKKFNDYIYLTLDLAQLKGSKYAKKRNLIKQFQKNYVDRDRVVIEPLTPSAAPACIEFLEKWCEERDCAKDKEEELDFSCEKKAATTALENIGVLDVNAILLRIDGVVSAIAIGAHLTETIGVLHFEKAFARVKGLYQYFDNECAKRLFNGYRYINKESDMGIPGIAKAKRSYYPVERVRSYRLTVK